MPGTELVLHKNEQSYFVLSGLLSGPDLGLALQPMHHKLHPSDTWKQASTCQGEVTSTPTQQSQSTHCPRRREQTGNEKQSVGWQVLGFTILLLRTLHASIASCLPLQSSPSFPSIRKGLHILSCPVEVQKSGSLVSIYNSRIKHLGFLMHF